MATVTYTGPEAITGRDGFTFYRDEPREVPDSAARLIADHPWFSVQIDGPVKRSGVKHDAK